MCVCRGISGGGVCASEKTREWNAHPVIGGNWANCEAREWYPRPNKAIRVADRATIIAPDASHFFPGWWAYRSFEIGRVSSAKYRKWAAPSPQKTRTACRGANATRPWAFPGQWGGGFDTQKRTHARAPCDLDKYEGGRPDSYCFPTASSTAIRMSIAFVVGGFLRCLQICSWSIPVIWPDRQSLRS